MKFTFIAEDSKDNYFGPRRVTSEFEAVTLGHVLDDITHFLRSCGYQVGYLEEVKDDEKSN